MKRMAAIIAFLAALGIGVASAQTATWKLAWDQPEALATVQTYNYTLKVDTGAASPITPTCSAVSGQPGILTTCSAPMPVLAQGPHTLVLTATNPFGSVSAPGLNGAPPSVAVSVRVVIVIQ